MVLHRKKIEEIQKKASALSEEVQNMLAHLERKLEELPEGTEYSDRAENLRETIDVLDTWDDNLTEVAEMLL